MIRTTLLLLLSLAFSLSQTTTSSAQEADAYRIWTDATGKFKVEAMFERIEDDKVFLKRKDNGQSFSVPLNRLGKSDLLRARRMARETPPANPGKGESTEPTYSAPTGAPGDQKKAWTGKWNNRKYGTDGPITCIATLGDDKTWKAVFFGVGIGKPFRYEAKITTTPTGNQMTLQGDASVDSDGYQWTGYVRGNVLYGRYRSRSGNNGEFTLRETQVPPDPGANGTESRRRR